MHSRIREVFVACLDRLGVMFVLVMLASVGPDALVSLSATILLRLGPVIFEAASLLTTTQFLQWLHTHLNELIQSAFSDLSAFDAAVKLHEKHVK